MREHEVNQLNNFIMGWYADDISFTHNLIQYHQESNEKYNGTFKKEVKESTDVTLSPSLDIPYWDHLKHCVSLYTKHYTHSGINCGLAIKQDAFIQHYPIDGGFKIWHNERGSALEPIVSRHLVFMTYLNDVPDGGTEFLYQGIKIKAETGLTIIWPTDWMFTHKSEISNTLEKWVVTGWINLTE
jgi:hypothetical protein